MTFTATSHQGGDQSLLVSHFMSPQGVNKTAEDAFSSRTKEDGAQTSRPEDKENETGERKGSKGGR